MLTLILKTTNGCNLDCRYCSLGKQTEYTVISTEMLVSTLEFVYKMGEKELVLILHGGEPTLVDMEIYRRGITAVREKFTDFDISVSMQTNGYHLTADILEFCKDFQVSVGISIDGSDISHDKQRLTKSQHGSYQQVQANILKYQQADIPISCLMVLTKNSLSEDFSYLSFFHNHQINLKINPLLPYGKVEDNQHLSLDSGDYSAYLIRLFEYAVKHGIDISVSPLTQIVEGILSGTPIRGCTFRENCHQDFLCVDYFGDIYPCGKFSDMHKEKLGNVKDCNYNIMSHPQLKELLAERSTHLPNTCKNCKFLSYCNGGCSAERAINQQETLMNCSDYQSLFHYFTSHGLQIIKAQLLAYKVKLLEEE